MALAVRAAKTEAIVMMIRAKRHIPAWQRALAGAGTIALIVWSWGAFTEAQTGARGTLTGTVSADRGQVIGFRVAAHNLDRRIWYTVFTNKGRYTVPQALPGRYE